MTSTPEAQETQKQSEDRSHRITTVAWLAGVSAVLGFLSLSSDMTLGAAIAYVAISGMVAAACYWILHAR
ncbi:MAG TPA: hypothetical protein VK968_12730 [Roseimicrobium sp.]|nr:hypothetical protein [Roseimicrobium sp.]